MPSLSHLLLNFLKLRPHAVASGFPFDLELSAAACSADEGEAQKVEGLRFSEPPMSAALHCEAAELDQTGLLRLGDREESLSRSNIPSLKRPGHFFEPKPDH